MHQGDAAAGCSSGRETREGPQIYEGTSADLREQTVERRLLLREAVLPQGSAYGGQAAPTDLPTHLLNPIDG